MQTKNTRQKTVVLVLLRHGEAESNKNRVFAGWADSDLTDNGITQAKLVGLNLVGLKLNLVFTSPLIRAIRTMHIALTYGNVRGYKIFIDKRLRGANSGDWTGKNVESLKNKIGEKKFNILSNSLFYGPPNGETMGDVHKRVNEFYLNSITPRLKDGYNVLIASHTDAISVLCTIIEHLNIKVIERLTLPNATLIIYNMDMRTLKVLNKKRVNIMVKK